MHEYHNQATRIATIEEARAEALRTGKAQVVGFHNWNGWTVEAADNTWAVAELGDVIDVPVPVES